MKSIHSLAKCFIVATFLWTVSLLMHNITNIGSAFAHERSFPTRQLKLLTPEGESVFFKASSIRPSQDKLSAFESKFSIKFTRGELLGDLYLGQDAGKKTKFIALFLDGQSASGDTEFGALVDTDGRIAKIAVFSSPEAAESTSPEFLKLLTGKNANELDATKKSFTEKEKSKLFIVELAQKAILRVEAAVGRK